MGLFKKSKVEKTKKSTNKVSPPEQDEFSGYVEKLLEQTDQPTDDEIDERFSIDNMSMTEKYSVDDAIKLVTDLPNAEPEVVATIVRKTLESADIDVNNIISSAQAKEDKLASDAEKINREINTLQEAITAKKQQLNQLFDAINETRKVKHLLQESNGLPHSDLEYEDSESAKPSFTDTGSFTFKSN